MRPSHNLCGGNTRVNLCTSTSNTIIVYIQPAANPRARMRLPAGTWAADCYDPSTGQWTNSATNLSGAEDVACSVSGPDAVAIFRKR